MKKQILFVAMSHKLTQDQIDSAKTELGIEQIILLSDVAPELQEAASNIDPLTSADRINSLAWQIVKKGIEVGGTKIYIAGEPCLTFWAICHATNVFNDYDYENDCDYPGMDAVQSTTERKVLESEPNEKGGEVKKEVVFKHVMWRTVRLHHEHQPPY